MIDYLEALLEEEAEETVDILRLGRRVLTGMGAAGNPPAEEEAVERGEGEESASEEWTVREAEFRSAFSAPARQESWPEILSSVRKESGEAGESEESPALAEQLQGAGRQVAALAALRETRGEEPTGAELYHTLQRAAQAARMGRRRPGTFSLTLPNRAAPAPGLTLTEIDRAVQRDSRRFDGGYTLY